MYQWFIAYSFIILSLFAQTFHGSNKKETQNIFLIERSSEVTMLVGEIEQVFMDVNSQIIGYNDTMLLNVHTILDHPDIVEVMNLTQNINVALASSFPISIRARNVGVVRMTVDLFPKDITTINIRYFVFNPNLSLCCLVEIHLEMSLI